MIGAIRVGYLDRGVGGRSTSRGAADTSDGTNQGSRRGWPLKGGAAPLRVAEMLRRDREEWDALTARGV